MVDVSNKTVAAMLVLSIVFSLGITLFALNRMQAIAVGHPISGLAVSGTSQTNLTIQSMASLVFRNNSVQFGVGYTNTSATSNCWMNTTGGRSGGATLQHICVNFTAPANQGLILENNGNRNLTVTLNSSMNATTFINGSTPGPANFSWSIDNSEANTCATLNLGQYENFTTVNNSGVGNNICTNMGFVDTNNTMRIDFLVSIPADALAGTRQATLTATGTEI